MDKDKEDTSWLESYFNYSHKCASMLDGLPISNRREFILKVLDSERAWSKAQSLLKLSEKGREKLLEKYSFESDETFLLKGLEGLHTYYQWAAYGFNTFNLSSGLMQKFRLTDPSGGASEVPAPFDAFLVILPRGSLEIGMWDIRRIWVNITSQGEDYPELIEVVIVGDDGEFFSFETAGWRFFFLDNPKIPDEFDGVKVIKPFDSEIPITKEVGKLIANLCFYLASDIGHAEASVKPPSPGLKRRAGKSWPRVWGLGKSVSVNPQLAEALKSGSSGWKLKFKHIVRGHWRNQACGKGHQERRVTWIEPYWKGPNVEEAWSHAYKVK